MRKRYRLKWQHELIIFAILLTTIPALVVGISLIKKTKQELTQNINLQLTNTSNNVSNEINLFFVDQIEKQYLIKKSIQSKELGGNEKVALIISAVSSIDEVMSISLLFKERDSLTTALQSEKAFIDSLDLASREKLVGLISNKIDVANNLLREKRKFGNPIFIESLDKWFIYTILEVKIPDAPEAYLVSLLDLSSLQKRLQKKIYTEVGTILVTNSYGESIFNSIDSLTNKTIVSDAVNMLKGNARVTEVSSYLENDEKFVVSISFTENVNWVVIAIENYNKAYTVVNEMNLTMHTWILIGISLAMFVSLLITARIRKPINHLVNKAKEISKGNYTIKVNYKLNDSIGTLGSTMESMSKSIQNSFVKIEKQNKELEEYSKTLEDKVKARTKKLKETNDDLQKAYLQVLELNNEKNEFLGIAAHDLKNPLMAIKGFGSIIRNDENLSRNQLSEFAGDIVQSSERMFDIITSLLDINKIEEGRVEIKYEKVSTTEFVKTILVQNSESASKKNISINFAEPHPDIYLETDRDLVLQIFDNILSNAIKFSPIDKSIEIRIGNEGDFTSIVVKDNGPGISDEDQLKLFKKFAKLSARPTGGENSTGLGLSIAKKITEILGGDILVSSKLGEGAEFKIILPK